SSPSTRGSSAVSSIPSSSRGPCGPTRCSPALSAPPCSSGASGSPRPARRKRPRRWPARNADMPRHFETGTAPFLIAGPCVVESDALNRRVGEALAALGARLGLHVVYKASYDKANRAHLKAARGPGLDEGLRALERVKAATGLPILTDVHEPGHVAAAAQVADVLQIPAFLCRQTDLLVAAGKAQRPAQTASFSRRIPTPTARRVTGRTCCRSTSCRGSSR